MFWCYVKVGTSEVAFSDATPSVNGLNLGYQLPRPNRWMSENDSGISYAEFNRGLKHHTLLSNSCFLRAGSRGWKIAKEISRNIQGTRMVARLTRTQTSWETGSSKCNLWYCTFLKRGTNDITMRLFFESRQLEVPLGAISRTIISQLYLGISNASILALNLKLLYSWNNKKLQ